jgi:pyruvate/2-oxoacid:ferredoxin oxidoreductase beta subunit
VFLEHQGRAGVSALELDRLTSGCAMMEVMKLVTRSFVLLLAAAVAAAPALLVACAIACHSAARGSLEKQATGGHSCHEAATAPASPYHLRGHSRGCNHDHHQPGVRVAGGDAGTPNKSVQAPIAFVTPRIGSFARRTASSSASLVRPPGSGTASSFLLPLRV